LTCTKRPFISPIVLAERGLRERRYLSRTVNSFSEQGIIHGEHGQVGTEMIGDGSGIAQRRPRWV
jgi:hypothetical protein